MIQADAGFWIRGPTDEFEVAFHDDDSAGGRIGWDVHYCMCFLIPRCSGEYHCWNCGDDPSPLPAGEGLPFGEPGATAWLALPQVVRNDLSNQTSFQRAPS
jgi:hypothetical protein